MCIRDSTGEGDGDLLLGDTIEDPQSEQPFEAVEEAMMYKELRRAVDSLPDRERKIIQYHFYRELSLKGCTGTSRDAYWELCRTGEEQGPAASAAESEDPKYGAVLRLSLIHI